MSDTSSPAPAEQAAHPEVARFLAEMRARHGFFSKAIQSNHDANIQRFGELGELMIGWAKNCLGDSYLETLCAGYGTFVTDVNRSQMKYERDRRYPERAYEDVFASVYDNAAYMDRYHWGVFVTTFAWRHHLDLHTFFRNAFVGQLAEHGTALDLGCGSGIWSLLLSHSLPGWKVHAVDISRRSVTLSKAMAGANSFANVYVEHGDALTHRATVPVDAALSCFLLEHLERPHLLFENLASNLRPGGHAFVTGALTAAEVDHIFEFSRESELVRMAEDSGFRVVATLSASPTPYSRKFRYLPRSMGLVLQKRENDVW
jgi:2-polyprenyl-3-methyl-5-hydroxy-6-metoxy-1,4-benzoquinol methylase